MALPRLTTFLNQGSIENRDFDAIEREMTTIADFVARMASLTR